MPRVGEQKSVSAFGRFVGDKLGKLDDLLGFIFVGFGKVEKPPTTQRAARRLTGDNPYFLSAGRKLSLTAL